MSFSVSEARRKRIGAGKRGINMNIRLKSMKRIVMMSAVAAALLAAGCDRGEKTVTPSIETVEFSAEAAEPSPYTVTAAYCRITNADDSTVLTAIERANRERIFGAEATADLQADFDAMVERLAGEYVCCDEELSHSFTYQFSALQNCETTRGGTILCYQTSYYIYTGGAHGLGSVEYDCYDLTTGQRYEFGYLGEDEWAPAVRQLISERLNAEYGEELFGTTPETAYVPSAVRITDTGLLLEYQPYEVAPYCVGIVGIELTDDQIAATGAPLIWIDEK